MPKKPFGPLGIPANWHKRRWPRIYLAAILIPKDALGVASTAVFAYSTSVLVLHSQKLLYHSSTVNAILWTLTFR